MIASERRLAHVAAGAIPGRHVLAASGRPGPAAWMREHRDVVLGRVAEAGWVLVRGLDVARAADFAAAIAALDLAATDDYGDLPRCETDDAAPGVYGVTDFPAEEAILFHHEGAHTPRPPRYLAFHCARPAPVGGETPLADSAQVLERLPPDLREAFAREGLEYERRFARGRDVPWPRYFGTSDPRAVEALCAAQGLRAAWDGDGGLSTFTRRPGTLRHPASGREVFFNQVLLHHPACLDPEVRAAFESDGDFALPREVRLGDGSPIPDAWIDAILEAHVRVAVAFRWEPGDVVVVDNLAVAHARCPYRGARRHHVMLGHDPLETRR